MASTHAKLLLAKTQSHRDIQNQLDLNCELFVNLGLRGKEYFEKVKAYLEAVSTALFCDRICKSELLSMALIGTTIAWNVRQW